MRTYSETTVRYPGDDANVWIPANNALPATCKYHRNVTWKRWLADKSSVMIFIVSELEVFLLTLAKVNTAKASPCDSVIIKTTDKNGFSPMGSQTKTIPTSSQTGLNPYSPFCRAKHHGWKRSKLTSSFLFFTVMLLFCWHKLGNWL